MTQRAEFNHDGRTMSDESDKTAGSLVSLLSAAGVASFGFTAGVADEAIVRPDVELVGIDRLYGGS
jgi:hypothetical protein